MIAHYIHKSHRDIIRGMDFMKRDVFFPIQKRRIHHHQATTGTLVLYLDFWIYTIKLEQWKHISAHIAQHDDWVNFSKRDNVTRRSQAHFGNSCKLHHFLMMFLYQKNPNRAKPPEKKTLRLHVVARWATYHKRLCKRRSNVSHQLFWKDARLGSKVSTKWVIRRNVPLFKGYNLFTNHLWTFPGHPRTTNKSSTDAPLWSQLLPLSLKVDVNTKKWPRIQL